MSKIFFDKLNNYFDQTIEISGFVENIRNLQWVQFLVIRDSKGKVQVTIEKHHKGKVFVKSRPNEGSTFGFWLPINPPEDCEEEEMA